MKALLFFLALLICGLYACQQQQPPAPVVRSPAFQKAASFLNRHSDSAYYYFNQFIGTSKDSLLTAVAYNYMAVIQSDAGDYFGSQESLLRSLKFLSPEKESDQACLSSDYNELGMTSLNLRHYPAAVDYFDQAIRYSADKRLLSFNNNKALAYQKQGAYAQALKLYDTILQQHPPPKTYARVLSNRAKTRWLANAKYNAVPELLRGLAIRQREKDDWGINASYAQLGDYYTNTKPDSALFYAKALYETAKRINSPDDQMLGLRSLIQLGPAGDARKYFSRYQKLNDSLQAARNAAKNQFALIRYDAEKNKADNLKLQKDVAEKKYELVTKNILLYIIVFTLISGTVIAWTWYRKRKQVLYLETENKINEDRFKLSKKVHDVVANDLYRIMTKVEHLPAIDKDWLLDDIEYLYEQSRDISYDKPPRLEDFTKKVGDLLTSFGNDSRRISIVGNEDAFWAPLNTRVRFELEQVLRELMVNMKKHSQARNIVVKFEEEGDQLSIRYQDDGVGFAENQTFNNGLTNTGNRIKAIHGAVIFEGKSGEGLKIQLHFPKI